MIPRWCVLATRRSATPAEGSVLNPVRQQGGLHERRRSHLALWLGRRRARGTGPAIIPRIQRSDGTRHRDRAVAGAGAPCGRSDRGGTAGTTSRASANIPCPVCNAPDGTARCRGPGVGRSCRQPAASFVRAVERSLGPATARRGPAHPGCVGSAARTGRIRGCGGHLVEGACARFVGHGMRGARRGGTACGRSWARPGPRRRRDRPPLTAAPAGNSDQLAQSKPKACQERARNEPRMRLNSGQHRRSFRAFRTCETGHAFRAKCARAAFITSC